MDLEDLLSEILSEFARTLATDFPIQAILDHLVVRIVEVMPITAAGVTLISPGSDPHYVAASNASALRFEQLQTDLGEGPCTMAYDTGEAVVVPDLREDPRFPTFGPRALEEGLVAVFTFPLRHGDHQLGALDLYRDAPGELDRPAMAAAQTLADVATAYLLNARARSDLEASAARAQHIALHDELTGLPNRALLMQRLEHAVLRSRRSKKMLAVLFADLDLFKAVNDTYGHQVGDELLRAVAERLTALLRSGDTVARLGGDEFVFLCEDMDDITPAAPLAQRISAVLSEPFELTTAVVQITASVGIAFAGPGEDASEQVLRDADSAMYQAKSGGGDRHAVIDLNDGGATNLKASLNRDLRGALRRGEMRIDYQPIVTTTSRRITGVEALLRWAHPTHGIIPPATVVPIAEQAGLITEIGTWVLREACVNLQDWQRQNRHAGLEISVNVSPHQLMDPDYAAGVADLLKETGTEPAQVILEVTESIFIHDSDKALSVLHELKEIGCRLALDDFGAGYSSLIYLKRFPFDIVKIDRSFITDLATEPTSRFIVNAIVGLAHNLKMSVIAEGVETETEYQQITTLNCDAYQGFHYARPASANYLDALLTGA